MQYDKKLVLERIAKNLAQYDIIQHENDPDKIITEVTDLINTTVKKELARIKKKAAFVSETMSITIARKRLTSLHRTLSSEKPIIEVQKFDHPLFYIVHPSLAEKIQAMIDTENRGGDDKNTGGDMS